MSHHRPGRAYWPAVAFLVASFILILIVSNRYLIPALRVSQGVDPMGKKHLAAISALVLTVVLFCLLVLLLMVFRPSKLLFPRRTDPARRPTTSTPGRNPPTACPCPATTSRNRHGDTRPRIFTHRHE